MKKYVLKRVLMAFLTLWAIITITFFLMHAVPGDPFSKEGKMPAAVYENLVSNFGLDKPLPDQYLIYLKNLAHLDFGISMKSTTETVNQMISRGFPVSATLGFAALAIALIFGPLLGCLAAINQNKWQDYMATVIAIIGVSVPSFVLGAVFIQLAATAFRGALPIGGWGSVKHVILPAISLAFMPLAYMARLMRSSMIEVLNQDYIKTARAKGLGEYTVIFRHGVRNAILPIISSLGTNVANLLVGSFVIEKIFGIPGLGLFFVQSINNRDYPLIMGTTIFYSMVLVFMILIVDLLYMLIDPRIKLTD